MARRNALEGSQTIRWIYQGGAFQLGFERLVLALRPEPAHRPLGEDGPDDLRPARQTIFHDHDRPSHVLLPVVPR